MKRTLPIYSLLFGMFLILIIQGCSKQNELEQLGLGDKNNSSIILITSPTSVDVLDINRIARIVTVKGAVIGAGLTSLSYTLDDGGTLVDVPSFDGSSPDFSFDIDFGDFTEGTLNDVSLKLIAKDASGVEVSETLAFKVKMNAYENPTVTITSPTISDEFFIADNIPSGLTGIANTAITITGTVYSQGASTYTYDIGNGPQPLTVVDNAFSQEILLSNVADMETKDITLTITATDEASQSGSGSVVFSANRWDIGSTKTESFTYDGAAVTYTIVRARDGEIWLQQNLGSTKVATVKPEDYTDRYSDQDSYGDYFQWGRWVDGAQKIGSTPFKTATTGLNPTSLNNLFVVSNGSTRWWNRGSGADTWDADIPADISATKGCDPCRAIGEGWRLPTKDELIGIKDLEGITDLSTAFNSNLKIPSSGYRTHSNGAWTGYSDATTPTVFIWSSTPTETTPPATSGNAYFLNLKTTTTAVESNLRAYGGSLRCVKKN